MGTKAGSHNGQAGERISREISEDANTVVRSPCGPESSGFIASVVGYDKQRDAR
jgi:hypothetical protein